MTTDQKLGELHNDIVRIVERLDEQHRDTLHMRQKIDEQYAIIAGTPEHGFRDGFAHRLNHVEDSLSTMRWWGTTALGAAVVSVVGAIMAIIGLGKGP